MKDKDTKKVSDYTLIEELTAAFRASAGHSSMFPPSPIPPPELHSIHLALAQIDFIYKQFKKDAPVTNLETVQHMNSKELATFIVTEAKKCISGIGDPVQELIEWLESPT